MKKILILTSISILMSIWTQDATAQGRVKEKIKSHKIAFISEKLDLSEVEAQKFWPIYNGYQSEKQDLIAKQNIKFDPNMTDAQADKLMDEVLTLRTKEIELQRRYIQKMKTAIPSRKVAMVFKYEREFQGEVISKVKNRQNRRE